MTKPSSDSEIAESVFRTLDFPVIVVTEDGIIVTASPAAESLVPGLLTCRQGAHFWDLLAEAPASFSDWRNRARTGCTVRVGSPEAVSATTIMVKAAPWEVDLTPSRLWVLSLHEQESFSRQKYEREILLRISSIPIPEMRSEGEPLTSDNSEASPITHELMAMIVKYVGGRSGILLRLGEDRQLGIIGQCGFPPEDLMALLSRIEEEDWLTAPEDGLLCNAARNGFPYSLDAQDNLELGLQNISGHLPFKYHGIWIDGISGFGAAITFFAEPPDPVIRHFATDAYVRLGRHLESSRFSNKLYEAYVELQNSQEQIIQASKMAAIGVMATGMAHELRQPVTAINNFFTTIFDYLEKERYGKLREHLGEYRDRSRRNIERLSRIIDHLRTFGRQEPTQFKPTDMNALIDETFNTFLNAQMVRRNIKVDRRNSPDLSLLEVDGPRIEQVILNILSNACDALENVPNPEITISLDCDADFMRIAISDNGPGIPPEIIDKVIDPFFTTKEAGKGTGLGLSVSHGIVRGHHGSLHIENRPEGGARFRIELPLRQT